jgi:chromosome segregation ATPase
MAGFDESRQVFYRMKNHLIPGGLVEEQERENSTEMRMFRLTSHGAEWVEKRARELEMRTTREQIRNYALEGYEAGMSAKESVQDYWKKLHRLKRRVERAEEDIEEVEDDQRENDKDVSYLRERSQAVRKRSIRNNNWLESLQDDVEEQATIGRVDGVRDDLSSAERRLTRVEDKQAGIVRQQAEAERTRVRLRRLAKPARYVAVGAMVAYLVVVVGVYFLASDLVASVVIGGIAGALGVAVGTGVAVSARGALS